MLELNAGRIHSMNTDGSDGKVILTDGRFPDGVLVHVDAGHIYWTNMGLPNDQVVMSRTPGSFRTSSCREARVSPSGWRVESIRSPDFRKASQWISIP